MRVRRSCVVNVPRADVWALVSDPWHLPRWWPNTERVEAVSDDGWTTVLNSQRGRNVRADWTLESSEPPSLRRWVQELEDSPFERLFDRNAIELRLESSGAGTEVRLAFEQKLRGWTRLAPFILRRAARRQIDAALSGLTQALEERA